MHSCRELTQRLPHYLLHKIMSHMPRSTHFREGVLHPLGQFANEAAVHDCTDDQRWDDRKLRRR